MGLPKAWTEACAVWLKGGCYYWCWHSSVSDCYSWYWCGRVCLCCMAGNISAAGSELCSALGGRVSARHRLSRAYVDSYWRQRRQPRLTVCIWQQQRSDDWSVISTYWKS